MAIRGAVWLLCTDLDSPCRLTLPPNTPHLTHSAILADETIVQRPELVAALTLPATAVVSATGAGAGASAGGATAVASASGGASAGVFDAPSGADVTGDLAVDFVRCHTFVDTVEAIKDRGVRR